MNKLHKIQSIIAAAIEVAPTHATKARLAGIFLHTKGYAEKGYRDPESGIVATGNWNTIDRWENDKRTLISDLPRRIEKILNDRYGVECEWSDEWHRCVECERLVRKQPDCHDWAPYWKEVDGNTTCGDCLKKDPEAYLRYIEDSERSSETIGIDPSQHGYTKVIWDLENGLHDGQTDDPKKIARALRAKGIFRFLFKVDSKDQFSIHFSVYVHNDEQHLFQPLTLVETKTP